MKKNSFLKDLIQTLLIVFAITFLVIKFILMPCVVSGDSMYPTLKEGQRGFSFVITKNIEIKRFDICVLQLNGGEDKLIVKRVIGMPNETIEYVDNKLYIDGVYYEEDYLDGIHTDDFKISLGEDEYYCLGDNRSVSLDSRYYGTFSKEDFKATNFFVFSPLKELGIRS